MTRAPSRPIQALLLFLLWLAVTTLTGEPPEEGQTVMGVMTDGIARQLALASALLAVAAVLLRWRGLGLGAPRPGTLRLLWLPGLYLLLYAAAVAATGLPPAGLAAVLLVNTLLGSFSEELMFRGFLYSGLRDRLSVWPSVAVATLLFGSVHMANAVLVGLVWVTALQSLAACLSGLMFLALRLRMSSIWPVILLHAAWNFGLILLGRDMATLPPPGPGDGAASVPALAQAGAILFVLPLGLYGLWLLRRVAREGDGLGPGAPARVPPREVPAPRGT